MIDLPKGDAKVFLGAYGIAAVYVAQIDRNKVAITATKDISRSVAGLLATCPNAMVLSVHWVDGLGKAERVVKRARAILAGGDGDVTEAAAGAAIANAAAAVGVRISSHVDTMGRLSVALAAFDARLNDAQAAGCLRFFNSAYRDRRLASIEAGRRFMTFSEAITRLRRYLIARHARQLDRALRIQEGDLLQYVFGKNQCQQKKHPKKSSPHSG